MKLSRLIMQTESLLFGWMQFDEENTRVVRFAGSQSLSLLFSFLKLQIDQSAEAGCFVFE